MRHFQPVSLQWRGSSYPPSSTNSRNAAFVTGVTSMRKGATVTSCAGRSLSYTHGSASVPITNPPPGSATSPSTDRFGVSTRPIGARIDAKTVGWGWAGGYSVPSMSWMVASMVSSCWCSCWITMPWTKPLASNGSVAVEIGLRERVEDAGPDVREIRARGPGVEDVEGRPVAARMLERVVHVVEVRIGRGRTGQRAQEPELLVVTDVREVPDQRRHERRHL